MLNANATHAESSTTDTDGAPMFMPEDLVAGLVPAFQDSISGETHLARHNNGEIAQLHTFTLLPDAWIAERDAKGNAIALYPTIVAGYWQCARFVSVEELLVQTWKGLS